MTQYKQNIPQATDLISVSQVDLLDNFTYLDTFLNVEHQQSGRDTAAVGSGRHRTVSMPNQALATILSVVPSVSPTTINTTAAHGFSSGDSVYISGVSGTTSTVLNGRSFIITVTGVSSFTIAVSTAGLTYVAGGTASFNPAVPAGTTGIVYQGNNQLFQRNATRVSVLTGNFALGQPGFTILPGNLAIQWGNNTINTSGTSTTITFPLTHVNASSVFSIQITCIDSSGSNSPTENNVFVKATTVTASQFTVTNSSSGSVTSIYWMSLGLI